jgi:hypothetical protein
MAVIMQAAASFIDFTGSGAAAAALCVLVVLYWAFSARRSSQSLGKELKLELVDTAASSSLPEPTDADLGLDFEGFQASVERECDSVLSRLCDDAVDDQVLRGLAEDFAVPAFFDEQLGCEGVDGAMAGDPPTLHDGDPGIHFSSFQDSKNDLKTFRAEIEQHCDIALEGMLDLAIDSQYCDTVLKQLTAECGGPSAFDDETLEGSFDLDETDVALYRQAEEVLAEQGRTLCADSAFDEAFQEYHEEYLEQLFCELEMVSQPLRCISLHEMIVQHIHKACGPYLLWAI